MSNELAARDQVARGLNGFFKNYANGDTQKAAGLYAQAMKIYSNPKLANCEPNSVITALTDAVALGLDLNPIAGQIYFLPYDGSLNAQIGAAGWAKLAMEETGTEIHTMQVYSCDFFESTIEEIDGVWTPRINFKPNMEQRQENEHDQEWVRANLKIILVTARKKNNQDKWVIDKHVVSFNEIERRRLMSQAQKIGKYTKPAEIERLKKGLPVGIWQEHYLSQAKKTAVALVARIVFKRGGEKATTLLEKINNIENAIDSTATKIEEPKAIEKLPEQKLPPVEIKPEPSHVISAEEATAFDATLSPAKKFDAETGEVFDITYTGANYVKGAILGCNSEAELSYYWEQVPDGVKPDHQVDYDAKLRLLGE